MTSYRRLLAEVLTASEVVSPTSFSWFGECSASMAPEVEPLIDPDTAPQYLIHNLQAHLYVNFYCPGGARRSLDNPSIPSWLSSSPFLQALSDANAGNGSRDPGWVVQREDLGAFVLERGGLSLWVSPEDIYPENGGSVEPGVSAAVLMPKELLRLSPGFYMALGEAPLPLDGSVAVVRFYWNLCSDGAVALIGALTRALNRRALAFRLKVVSDPECYSRCDAGVLYMNRADYEVANRVICDVYHTLASMLKPATPALTKELAPGLALAEDPSGHLESFGMSRCHLLAEGIVAAAKLGLREPEQRLQFLEEHFAGAGIDLDAPYLNSGSTDIYRFPEQ
jgi:HopA1 effector protein family